VDVRILVSGAGIGGLAVALRLRDHGHQVTVLERTPEPRDIGGGILVPPNSMRILHQLGLEAQIAAVGVRPSSRQVRRWADGSTIAVAPLGDAVQEMYGAPYMVMHRADLHGVLLEAATASTPGKPDIEVRFGTEVVDSDTVGEEAVATDAGGEEYRADVLVGADGLHSAVRRSIGLLDEPTFEGNILWWALLPIEEVRKDPRNAWVEETLSVVVGPERHVVHFPVRRGEFVMLAAIVPWTAELPESWSAVGDREAAIEPFTSWDDSLFELMKLAKVVHPWPLLDRDPFDYWTKGRVALLGDAAHPMLPHQAQGAAQAVEDAWVLAEKLRDADPRDVPAALSAYEKGRIVRATAIQQASRDHGAAYHLPDGPQQRERDRIMAAQSGNAAISFDWLWGGDPESRPPA
jgi:salicylate hydroxylase